MIACTFPPGARCFPGYQALIVSPFALVVVSAQRSVWKTLPSTTTCDQPCSATSVRASCSRGRVGEHVDHFVAVAVSRRPGDSGPGAEQGEVALVAEPGQDQHRRARRSTRSSDATFVTSSRGTSSMAPQAISWGPRAGMDLVVRTRYRGLHVVQHNRLVACYGRIALASLPI